MQGRYQVFIAPAKFVFQSSSSPKTGCKVFFADVASSLDWFQSSSSPKTGCKGWGMVR